MKQAVLLFIFLSMAMCYADLFYIPNHWPEPHYDFNNNRMSAAKVKLGRVLFFDPTLSADNTISCASCHSPFSAFAHTDHNLSHGISDSIGTRNAPALMNLAWQDKFMWDGAIHHLDMLALAPITHPSEMGSTLQDVVCRLNSKPQYKKLFTDAYSVPEVTGEKTLKAMSQFILTLISANSKYDAVMTGRDTFNDQEENGYRLFKIHCASCHKEPLFTTHQFANNGLPLDSVLNDHGRSIITGRSSDDMTFKIPTLRNIEFTYPYMHDGRFKRLSQVLNHYTKGITISTTLAPELRKGIILTANEKVDITAFLLTLSDKSFVFNKDFQFPKELMQ